MTHDTRKTRCLLLAGSSLARSYCGSFFENFENARLIVSRKGAVADCSPYAPPRPNFHDHIGGFGGISALVDFIDTHHITHIIDATHIHADQMHWHAKTASQIAKIPLLRLTHQPWDIPDHWQQVTSNAHCVRAIKAGEYSRVFLAMGAQRVADFAMIAKRIVAIRTAKGASLPKAFHHCIHSEMTPHAHSQSVDAQNDFLQRNNIDLLVVRNSGIAPLYNKCLAADSLQIPVIVLQPPQGPPSDQSTTVNEAINWLKGFHA